MLRYVTAAVGILSFIGGASAQTPSAERGSYLVNTILTCGNCHTPKGPPAAIAGKDFSGGLRFDEPPFDVTAPNITPDKETGIGNWTRGQIKTLMRTGVRPDGVNIAPIMPTGFYEIMTEADLDAVVDYLVTLAPVKNKVPDPIYKMQAPRQVLPGAEKPMPQADLADPVKRGFYLVTIGHCMECHTPMDKGVRPFDAKLGAGGFDFHGPWGVSTSRNITSSKTKGIGAWTDDEIKRAITQGVSKDGAKLKPPMGYELYAKMTADDLNAVVAYLRTVPAKE